MSAPAEIYNLSDVETKRKLMTKIGSLQGPHTVTIKPIKRTRSLDANRYYFAAVVSPFCYWLSEQYGEKVDTEQAHEMLKARVLGYQEKILDGGELMELPRRTRTMDTGEFSQYVEDCARFLAEFCGIAVIPSDLFFEKAS